MEKSFKHEANSLIRGARNGNADSINELLKYTALKVKKSIYSQVRDRSIVNDVTQDVLLKVFRYLHCFREESHYTTWLYKVVQNTLKNYYRSVGNQFDLELKFYQEMPGYELQNPEYSIMLMEFNVQVDQAIDKLSEELRACYYKYLYEGLTYEDIAKTMQCPIGTVRSRIFRAKKLIQLSVKH